MSSTGYTAEIAAQFCALIADGLPLRAACQRDGMPSKATVFRWLRDNEDFQKLYAQATDDRADTMMDEVVAIADKCLPDKNSIAKARMQIYARELYCAKMRPKKYGNKVTNEHTGPGGGPVQIIATDHDEAL